MKINILLIVALLASLQAQTIKSSVEEILSTNPILQERLKNYNSIKEDITTAEAGYYPKLDISLGVGVETTDKSFPIKSTNTSSNFNVYQGSLTYSQNIFNGFETTYQVKQKEHQTISAAYSYIEKVNNTSFEMVNSYLQIMKNKELLKTAQENVDIDEEIFNKVQKLYDSGLTTLSEVNKVESSLALAKSNKIVQENTLLDVTYNIHKILGRYIQTDEMVKPTLNIKLPSSLEEATQFAILNNPSLLVSNENIKLAQAQHSEKESSFYPQIDIEISKTINNNLSGIEVQSDSFKAMALLKYNLFNGFADSSALQKSVSNIHREIEVKNNLRRQVIEGLNLSWAANTKLTEQLKYLKNYKKFSLKTLMLYSKEYDLGRRSLLDLLSAQNDFIGAKSQIITTEYNILFAKYRVLDALGTLVPTIIGDTNIIYSKVGLLSQTPQNSDSLPIRLDRDNDLIPDDKDICNNSKYSDFKNIYGCSFKDENISTIERYSGFEFSDNKLSSKAKERLNALIQQLSSYGFKNITFELLSSTNNSDVVKKSLIEAGALEKNIISHLYKQSAPLFIDDEEKNNRVDIIVIKNKK